MESYHDIERMLSIENRDKKRTGNGIFGRTTKVGKYAGFMRTPVDILKGKAKRQYKGNGKVVRYNMYESMSFEEFKALNTDEQKKVMKALMKKYPNSGIADLWDIKEATVYYWIQRTGLKGIQMKRPRKKPQPSYKEPETANTNLVPATKNETAAPETAVAEQEIQEAASQAAVSLVENVSNRVDTSTFTFHYQETVAGRTAAKKLEKLALFLEDEDTKYEVLLQVKEKGE